MKKIVQIDGKNLTIEDVVAVAQNGAKITYSQKIIDGIQKNWDTVAEMIEEGMIVTIFPDGGDRYFSTTYMRNNA